MGPDELIDEESCPLSDYVYFQEGPGIRKSQNVDDGVCYLNIRCFVEGRIDKSSMHQVLTTEAFGKYKHFLLDAGDYVVSSSGTLGRLVEIFPEDLPVMLNTSTIRFRPKDASQLDRVFLRYFLLSATFQSQVRKLATGSVQLNFGPSHLQQVRMPKVPLIIQRGIVSIVEPIDEKITTNKTQIKTLESIAQTIFKSWFIDFDPVKAKMAGEKPVGMDDATAALFPDSMVDSELGPIPSGWNVRSLADIGEFRNGLAMQKFPVIDDENVLPVIKIAQLRAGNTAGADRASGLIDSKFVISDGDILFSWSGTLEIEHWAGGQGALNQHLFKVLGKTVPDWFIYFSSRNHLPDFRRIASGKATTMGHIQRGHLAEAKVAVPPVALLTSIGELFSSLVSEKVALVVQNRALAELRDALLPRLISGELQIPEEMLGV